MPIDGSWARRLRVYTVAGAALAVPVGVYAAQWAADQTHGGAISIERAAERDWPRVGAGTMVDYELVARTVAYDASPKLVESGLRERFTFYR